MTRTRRWTRDAEEILHRRFYEGRPRRIARLINARLNGSIGQAIYDLRMKARLSQRQLAARVRTTASVICRLEDADYEGHSLSMLKRIAAALDCMIDLRLVPLRKSALPPRRKATKKRRKQPAA